ncbi:MAG: hypothetical protein LBM77_09505 [Spirochaetaceae bacterium]|nr:hypothetical protein [Spirochaetaceae bacterium]
MRLILLIHQHLPLSASDEEAEELYAERLKPFVQIINKNPRIKAALHFSGVLLNRMEKLHPEFIFLLENLLKEKKIELLGGGFYEPLYPMLSQTDKAGQIEMFTTYLRKTFGKRPQGCWLPDDSWAPGVAATLNGCNLAYTFLDSSYFFHSGVQIDILNRPYLTEDLGKTVTIFPLFRPSDLEYLYSIENVQKDDADHVVSINLCHYGNKEGRAPWKYLEEYAKDESKYHLVLPNECYKKIKRISRCYISTKESGEHPMQTIARNPEASALYSRILYTEIIINQIHGDKERKNSAREEIWKAQSIDAFREGYKDGIRRAKAHAEAYSALLHAELLAREKKSFSPSLSVFDYDFDGEDEYLFQGSQINTYVQKPGARIFELDFLPGPWNYLNKKCGFEDSLNGKLIKDLYDCVSQERTRTKQKASFKLEKNEYAIEINKTFILQKDSLTCLYKLINRSLQNKDFTFSTEIPLCFKDIDEKYLRIISSGAHESPQGIEFQDIVNEAIIAITTKIPQSPQISKDKDNLDTMIVHYSSPVSLKPGEIWSNEFCLRFSY